MRCIPLAPCPYCGGEVIHQTNRQLWESSSGLGQYVKDRLPQTFYWHDLDAVTFCRDTGALRLMEVKERGGYPTMGQRATMTILSQLLSIRQHASVWIVETNPPYDCGLVRRVRPGEWFDVDDPIELSGDQWHRFLSGRHA